MKIFSSTKDRCLQMAIVLVTPGRQTGVEGVTVIEI